MATKGVAIDELLNKQRQYFVDKYDEVGSPLSNEDYWMILKDIDAINVITKQAILALLDRETVKARISELEDIVSGKTMVINDRLNQLSKQEKPDEEKV